MLSSGLAGIKELCIEHWHWQEVYVWSWQSPPAPGWGTWGALVPPHSQGQWSKALSSSKKNAVTWNNAARLFTTLLLPMGEHCKDQSRGIQTALSSFFHQYQVNGLCLKHCSQATICKHSCQGNHTILKLKFCFGAGCLLTGTAQLLLPSCPAPTSGRTPTRAVNYKFEIQIFTKNKAIHVLGAS